MAQRSSRLVAIGAAVFLVGAGLVFVGLRSGAPDEGSDANTPTASDDSGSDVTVVAQGGTTALPQVAVPDGLDAVAVSLPRVPGLAGYVQPGERVNIFATVKGGARDRGLEPPYAKLILPNVLVLDVQQEGDPTFLLALPVRDVERVIFLAKYESVWFTLAAEGARASTSGRDYANVL